MADESCRLPGRGPSDADAVRRMLAARRIAIVGLSDDPARPSHDVARYLMAAGKEVLAVNPTHRIVLGLPCYPELEAVPGRIEVVNVFRRAEFCADVARSAVRIGAAGLWLQSGIISHEAEEIARKGGIDFVQDRCIKVEHMFRAS